jgi:NadR type nicotinamide-nucleotide adenylyltransferase
MTAMPPTTGHAALIDFASRINDVTRTEVVVCTQPSEPFAMQRAEALMDHFADQPWIDIIHLHEEMEQNASAPGFWAMWKRILDDLGMTRHDVVVSSESYGQRVADLFGAKFMPYDPERQLNKVKATDVRRYPAANMNLIIPEFQKYLIRTTTVFGAESVGKTTQSKDIASIVNGHWRFEYARPYLEMVGKDITAQKMFDIFDGQEALQKQARDLRGKAFVIQDTDLYSTIGYMELWTGEKADPDWYFRARALKSDLYIILTQNIPFEEDPLRYGGDKRESDDQYWIDLCEREGLNYVVVDEDGKKPDRLYKAMDAVMVDSLAHTFALRNYERKHNG